jgi:hypothetical protein
MTVSRWHTVRHFSSFYEIEKRATAEFRINDASSTVARHETHYLALIFCSNKHYNCVARNHPASESLMSRQQSLFCVSPNWSNPMARFFEFPVKFPVLRDFRTRFLSHRLSADECDCSIITGASIIAGALYQTFCARSAARTSPPSVMRPSLTSREVIAFGLRSWA